MRAELSGECEAIGYTLERGPVRTYSDADGNAREEWRYRVARVEPSGLWNGDVAIQAECTRLGADGERVGGSLSTLHVPAEALEPLGALLWRAAERARGEEDRDGMG